MIGLVRQTSEEMNICNLEVPDNGHYWTTQSPSPCTERVYRIFKVMPLLKSLCCVTERSTGGHVTACTCRMYPVTFAKYVILRLHCVSIDHMDLGAYLLTDSSDVDEIASGVGVMW